MPAPVSPALIHCYPALEEATTTSYIHFMIELFEITAPPLYTRLRCSFSPSKHSIFSIYKLTRVIPKQRGSPYPGSRAQPGTDTPHGPRTASCCRGFAPQSPAMPATPLCGRGRKKLPAVKAHPAARSDQCQEQVPLTSSPPCHFSRMKHTTTPAATSKASTAV